MRSRTGSVANERGAAATEYIPLLFVIALLVIIAVTFIGPWVSDQLGDATVPFDPDACPAGWDLDYAETVEKKKKKKKNGSDVNKNGDPFVCVKTIPGNGEGNTGDEKNVKDNKRPTP